MSPTTCVNPIHSCSVNDPSEDESESFRKEEITEFAKMKEYIYEEKARHNEMVMKKNWRAENGNESDLSGVSNHPPLKVMKTAAKVQAIATAHHQIAGISEVTITIACPLLKARISTDMAGRRENDYNNTKNKKTGEWSRPARYP